MRKPSAHRSAVAFILTTLLLYISLIAPTSAKITNSSVDINTASAAQLNAVKGIGAVTAQKIIANRPYRSIDELSKAGLTAKAIDKLRAQLTVAGGSSSMTPPGTTAKPVKPTRQTATTAALSTANGPVDLNTADSQSIEALPGVGPSLAASIIAARPYQSVDDLAKVKGIGAAKYAKLRDKVIVRGSSAVAAHAAPMPARTLPTRTMTPAAAPAAATAPAAVPAAAIAARAPAAKPATLASGTKVNINSASLDELNALPEIGPVKAQAIIAGRPYVTPEDIMKVRGIKAGTYAKIKNLITVR